MTFLHHETQEADEQRKIFMYAAHYLPRLGYAKRAHLMNPMVPGLSGGKMSSSDPKSKIDFLDTPSDVKSKIKAALCTPGEVEGNGILAFIKTVLIPIQNLRIEQALSRGDQEPQGENSFVKIGAPKGTVFTVSRPEKYGGDLHFANYEALEAAYVQEQLHPGDVKGAVTEALIQVLTPIRQAFDVDEEWKEAELSGYPGASVQAESSNPKSEPKVSIKRVPVSQRLTFSRAARLKRQEKSEISRLQRKNEQHYELRKRRRSG